MSTKTTVRPLKSLLARGPTKAEHAALVAERKAVAALPSRSKAVAQQPTRDILLQKGYDKVLNAAPAIMDRLIEGALNRDDPLHERCLDIMAKRAVPIAFYEGLSKQEFRPEEEQNRQPTIVINVTGAAGLEMLEHKPLDVVDVEPDE